MMWLYAVERQDGDIILRLVEIHDLAESDLESKVGVLAVHVVRREGKQRRGEILRRRRAL